MKKAPKRLFIAFSLNFVILSDFVLCALIIGCMYANFVDVSFQLSDSLAFFFFLIEFEFLQSIRAIEFFTLHMYFFALTKWKTKYQKVTAQVEYKHCETSKRMKRNWEDQKTSCEWETAYFTTGYHCIRKLPKITYYDNDEQMTGWENALYCWMRWAEDIHGRRNCWVRSYLCARMMAIAHEHHALHTQNSNGMEKKGQAQKHCGQFQFRSEYCDNGFGLLQFASFIEHGRVFTVSSIFPTISQWSFFFHIFSPRCSVLLIHIQIRQISCLLASQPVCMRHSTYFHFCLAWNWTWEQKRVSSRMSGKERSHEMRTTVNSLT